MTENKPVKKRDPLYITIIILLLIAGAFSAYQWNHFSAQYQQEANTNAGYQDYIHQLEAELGSAGLDFQSTDLMENLKDMLGQMDTLKTDNQEMIDSIAVQKQRVTGLLAEVEQMKKTGKYNRRTIFKLRAETETLRKVMRHQVHKIDSLYRQTIVDAETISGHEKTISGHEVKIKDLSGDKAALEATVDAGSKLQTSGMKADALRVRSSGNYKETPRAKSTNMIRSCFTIMGNRIAQAGDKTIYMRIIAPSGGVMSDGSPDLFEAEGGQKEASIKRTISYQKENMDFCIFYEVPSGSTVEPGDYIVKIYCEGVEIASTSFSLK